MSIVPYTHLAHAHKVKDAHVTVTLCSVRPARCAVCTHSHGDASKRKLIRQVKQRLSHTAFYRVCMLVSFGHL